MQVFHIHISDTPLGDITVIEKAGSIAGVYLDKRSLGEYCRTELLDRCEVQLREYFRGERKSFDLPLNMEGTDFQYKVWKMLTDIPYGMTVTYGELARRIGSPGAARAVGAACGVNPIAIMVPCHRVLGKNGLTGYAYGLDKKKTLLKIENLGNNY